MSSSLRNRISDVGFESFQLRSPIPGLSKQCIIPLERCLESIELEDKETYLGSAQMLMSSKSARAELSQDEAMAIYLYTCEWDPKESSLYYLLNSSLRDPDRSKLKPYLPLLKLLLSAILKVPSTVKTTLWRGVDKDLFEMYRAKTGEVVVFWGFTSTTTDLPALERLIPMDLPQRTLFMIRTTFGADVKKWSAFAAECEVVLPPAMAFKVINVSRMSVNLVIVELEEVKNLLIGDRPPDPCNSQPNKSVADILRRLEILRLPTLPFSKEVYCGQMMIDCEGRALGKCVEIGNIDSKPFQGCGFPSVGPHPHYEPVPALRGHSIRALVTTESCLNFAISDRRLFAWGFGQNNSFGHADDPHYCSVEPVVVLRLPDHSNETFVQLASAPRVGAALTSAGRLFTWGHFNWGIGKLQGEPGSPSVPAGLVNRDIVAVAAVDAYCPDSLAAVTRDGLVLRFCKDKGTWVEAGDVTLEAIEAILAGGKEGDS